MVPLRSRLTAAVVARKLSARMSRRRLAGFLVLLAAMLVIVGCGGGSRSKSSHRDSAKAPVTTNASPTNAAVSSKLITMLQDDAILASPTTQLPLVRALGATTVRVFQTWYSL